MEYVFELDIKDEQQSPRKDNSPKKGTEPQRNPLFLDFDNFSLFKIRSTIFLIDFPMNFMIRIMDMWSKLIPQNPLPSEHSKEDIALMASARSAIKEFRLNLLDYIEHL